MKKRGITRKKKKRSPLFNQVEAAVINYSVNAMLGFLGTFLSVEIDTRQPDDQITEDVECEIVEPLKLNR